MSDLETRIDTRGSKPCPYCLNDGWIVANVRDDGAEEMGPCPACRIGYANEFGGPDTGRKGSTTPWGEAGFWRGRPWAEYASKQDHREPDADPARAQAFIRQMGQSLGLYREPAKAPLEELI